MASKVVIFPLSANYLYIKSSYKSIYRSVLLSFFAIEGVLHGTVTTKAVYFL